MKRSVLKKYRGGPAIISLWCPVCEVVYALPALRGVALNERRCPYGHAGLQRSWIAKLLEAGRR